MASFNVDQLDELIVLVVQRENQLNMECINRHTPKIMAHIQSIISMDSIMERLKEKCKTHNNPWDLAVPFYGYSGTHKLEPGSRVTRSHIIDRPEFLYHLDEMFNGERPHGGYRFRVTVRRVRNNYNWYELVLHYYSRGVPVKLIRSDPNMPALETGHDEPLPASPIPMMNPEDDDMSDHGGGCVCRDCRNHYGWNRD
jgi:hypothetical protein